MRRSQFDDPGNRVGLHVRQTSVLANHLQQRSARNVIPPGSVFVGSIEKQRRRSPRPNQIRQCGIALFAGFLKRRERCNLAHKPASAAAGLSKFALASGQCLPDHVVECMHGGSNLKSNWMWIEPEGHTNSTSSVFAIRFLRENYSTNVRTVASAVRPERNSHKQMFM